MSYTKKNPKYTFIKDNVYYFTKADPSVLRHYYNNARIVLSLKTKSVRRAATASQSLAVKLNVIG